VKKQNKNIRDYFAQVGVVMSKEGMKNRDFPRIGLLLDLVNDAMEDE